MAIISESNTPIRYTKPFHGFDICFCKRPIIAPNAPFCTPQYTIDHEAGMQRPDPVVIMWSGRPPFLCCIPLVPTFIATIRSVMIDPVESFPCTRGCLSFTRWTDHSFRLYYTSAPPPLERRSRFPRFPRLCEFIHNNNVGRFFGYT